MVKRTMFTKLASHADLQTTVGIMRKVHAEDPSYWPYGLDATQFDGGLYMISKQANSEPVGFVGWQVRQEDRRSVGYYAVGVLPEYRQQGFAKEAVTKLLREKSASVDEVRALVCSHNNPSLRLAKSLGVELIEKSATHLPPLPASTKRKVIGSVLGALGSTVFYDQSNNHDRTLSDSLQPWKWDKGRALVGGMNALLGGLGGHLMVTGHEGKGLAALATAPIKDLALKGIDSLHKIDAVSDASLVNLNRPRDPGGDVAAALGAIPKPLLLGALGLGVGGIGLAAYSAKANLDVAQAQESAARGGRVKVTLPTKKPGDTETTIDLPMEDMQLSKALRLQLGRDTRRRLYSESNDRTRRRKPRDPNAPTDREEMDMQLQEEEDSLSKESRIVNLLSEIRPMWAIKEATSAAPMVPTPPPQGVNPAMRMTQQQVTANAMQPSTEANPQILKAQSDAAQAQQSAAQQSAQSEQAAAQQAAQLQQESAQAQMDQQQKFSEQLSQANQANDILKMQVEKSKVESELSRAREDAERSLTDHHARLGEAAALGEQSAVQRLTQSRLDRLQAKLSKSATAVTTPPPAKEALRMKPNAAQAINDNGFLATGSGMIAPNHIYRTSYGKAGDWLYSNFIREGALTPAAVKPGAGMSYSSIINSPDRMGMIETASAVGENYMKAPQL